MEDSADSAVMAVELYKSGRVDQANRTVEALLEGETTGLLSPLETYGEELRQNAEEIILGMSSWHMGQSTIAPDSVGLLHTLAGLLSDRTPLAQSWNIVWLRWKCCLVNLMREEMLRLNKKGSNELALQVCKQAILVSVHPGQIAQLEQDKAVLAPFVGQMQARRRALEDVSAVSEAPSLTTVNFIGFRLYGHTPCPEDPRLYYANRYFTVLWVPIFPIDRYLVEKTGAGQWHLHGQSRWTTAMKVHLIAAMAMAIILSAIVLTAMS